MSLFSHPFTPPGATTAPQGAVERMNQILAGDMTLQIVRAAAEHDLAGHAAAGPVDPAALATTAGLDPAVTPRFLRAAAAVGLLTEDDDGVFHGTDLLEVLHRDHPVSMREQVLAFGDTMISATSERLPEALRRGHALVEEALGASFFAFLAADPERLALFLRCMGSLTVGVAERVVELLDLGDARTLVDVGGGDGSFVRAFLRARPDLHATVLDTPHAIGTARAAADAQGLGERVTTVGGDFFAEVPAGDVCLVKHIVHDWPDDEAVAILTRCREAVGPSGRVVVVEQVVGEPGSEVAPLFDMVMLTTVDGRERTRAEFAALLARAGLTLREIVHTGVADQVLVAVPAA